MADDCIFCKIVAGELASEIVQEDEHTLAFMDINPWTRGHALVIPRHHSKNLYEAPEDDLAHASAAAKRLALTMRERLGCDGVNLLNCCEPAAWQTVFHLHLHVIPRYDDDPLQLPVPPQPAEAEELSGWPRSSVAEPAREMSCFRRRALVASARLGRPCRRSRDSCKVRPGLAVPVHTQEGAGTCLPEP